MCGFAGFLLPERTRSWDPHAAIVAMSESLAHRGPDDEGVWIDERSVAFLGFRRLAILDLSDAGHQPMVSGSERYVVTFNGELYNFLELRRELEGSGARFVGDSDTEVLLAAVDRWGVDRAVRRFRGMFAFSLWDKRKRELWLARDRMGIKPLYLLTSTNGLAWASECRAFHHCPLFDGRGDREAAWHFLRRLYVPGPYSILEGVEKLVPGELVRVGTDDGTPEVVQRTRYWDLVDVAASASAEPVSKEDVVDRLHDHIRESVRLRLVADVPVGALLSGGIDSSVVVGVMQELSSDPVRTFTISFDDPSFDEGSVAAEVAGHLGTKHSSVAFHAEEVRELIPSLPSLSDEPMANPSLLPTLLISRVARQDVVVALCGDGGDELFGGYNRYRLGGRLIRWRRALPGPVRGLAATVLESDMSVRATRALLQLQGGLGPQHSSRERLRKLSRLLRSRSDQEAYESLLAVGMFDPPLKMVPPGRSLRPDIFLRSGGELESRMMLLDQLEYLPDDLLTKIDRASMWESLEARVPLLDQEVVRFSWSIPSRLKIRNNDTKWPLRSIASRYVPASILERPKMGFTVPIARWLRSDLREWVGDTLFGTRADSFDGWQPSKLERIWSAFEDGRNDLALPLWTAAVLQAWSHEWGVTFG